MVAKENIYETQDSQEHEGSEQPRVGILYCGGAMSSAGELTAVASFEVMKRLGPKEVGMGCVSALAAGIPKHFKTMQGLEKVIVIDGCPNSCAHKVVENTGSKMDAYINLGKDLGIKKIGPFKPLEFSPDDFERAVLAIIKKVQENDEIS
jgi:uncharacterized metal-binding protein